MIFQRIYLIIKEIFSQKIISIIVLFTIIITILCVGSFEIVSSNFNQYINNRFAANIPPNFIKISVDKKNKKPISDKTLKKIRKISGVKKLHSYMAAKFPVQATINFSKIFPLLRFGYRTDLIWIGAPYSIVHTDIKNWKYQKKWKNWRSGNRIPFLVPKVLLEAYNQSMAEANNLPKIDKAIQNLLLGSEVDLNIGKSSINMLSGYHKEIGELVGITDKIATLAMVVPIKVINHYNKKLLNTKSKKFIYTFIEVKNHKALLSVATKVRKFGFLVETELSLSKEIKTLKDKVNLVLNSLMLIIIILSVIAISVSTIIATLNRTEYYRIMRILGASKIFITFNIVLKYAFFGFIGSYFSMYLIKFLFLNKNIISIAAYNFSLEINSKLVMKIIYAGTIIPVISTIPAIIKLYTKSLNCD